MRVRDDLHYRPVSPERLSVELADLIEQVPTRPGASVRIGVDGLAEVGTDELADAIGRELARRGRLPIRVSTRWWWRAAALRLEFGRRDVDALLSGWLDIGALRRELLDPLGPGGDGRYLIRLRDPDTDRSLREPRRTAPAGTVLLLDGPFLVTGDLPLDAVIALELSEAAVRRRLPADRQWWLEAWRRYRDAAGGANTLALVAYDHPRRPALRGAAGAPSVNGGIRARPPTP